MKVIRIRKLVHRFGVEDTKKYPTGTYYGLNIYRFFIHPYHNVWVSNYYPFMRLGWIKYDSKLPRPKIEIDLQLTTNNV